jgi:hypothetical protein
MNSAHIDENTGDEYYIVDEYYRLISVKYVNFYDIVLESIVL